MGGGRDRKGLDDAGQLAQLLGDAVALPGEERHFGADLLDDTPRLCPHLVRLLSGLRDDRSTLGASAAQLFVSGALEAEHLLGHLLAERTGSLLGLGEAVL